MGDTVSEDIDDCDKGGDVKIFLRLEKPKAHDTSFGTSGEEFTGFILHEPKKERSRHLVLLILMGCLLALTVTSVILGVILVCR